MRLRTGNNRRKGKAIRASGRRTFPLSGWGIRAGIRTALAYANRYAFRAEESDANLVAALAAADYSHLPEMNSDSDTRPTAGDKGTLGSTCE